MLEVCVRKKRMKVSRSNAEYLYGNEQNYKETVKMKDAKASRVKEFKYLGSMVQENGSCEREIKKRAHAAWNVWKKYRE